MLKIVIIEDEPPAARRLEKMLRIQKPALQVLAQLDSVERCKEFFTAPPEVDLVFMDIQLADGISFEIFSHCQITAPIIFTTAFDDYTLQAFKVNSIDYLLKPIDQDDLDNALQQFDQLIHSPAKVDQTIIQDLLQSMQQKAYKERFLIKSGQHLSVIQIPEIAYFVSDDGYVQLVTHTNKKHLIEYNLEQLTEIIDPNFFYRINRKFILHIDSIKKINSYFNSRLKLNLQPSASDDVIVSRERVTDFKRWLDR